jgi:hypothetical protein
MTTMPTSEASALVVPPLLAIIPPLFPVEPPRIAVRPPALSGEPAKPIVAASTPARLPPEVIEAVPQLPLPVCAPSFVGGELEHAWSMKAIERNGVWRHWI